MLELMDTCPIRANSHFAFYDALVYLGALCEFWREIDPAAARRVSAASIDRHSGPLPSDALKSA